MEIISIGPVPYFTFLDPTPLCFAFFPKKKELTRQFFLQKLFFDIYYSRNRKQRDKISDKEFFQNCQKNLKQTNKNTSLAKNRKGWILKIGTRESNQYFRIYETKISLKFDYERKSSYTVSSFISWESVSRI